MIEGAAAANIKKARQDEKPGVPNCYSPAEIIGGEGIMINLADTSNQEIIGMMTCAWCAKTGSDT